MEINNSSALFGDQIRYQKAKKEARVIRDFYINLSFFCICIPIVIVINLYFVPEFHWFWFSVIGWGSGLLFHGLSAFRFNPFMIGKWEERKLQEFINQDLGIKELNNPINITHMERLRTADELKLQRVTKRVKKISGFYKHFAAYAIINIVLIAMRFYSLENGQTFFKFSTFSTAFFWGIGLLFHAINVFGKNMFLSEDWEEKKINEYMGQNETSKWE